MNRHRIKIGVRAFYAVAGYPFHFESDHLPGFKVTSLIDP